MSERHVRGDLPPNPPGKPQRISTARVGLGVAWLVGTAAGIALIDRVMGQAPLATVIASAVIVDLAASRAGVKWAEAGKIEAKDAARRAGLGAAFAAGIVVVTALIALALGWLHVEGATPNTAFFIALVRAIATAVRDELLYRGIPLATASAAGVRPVAARVYAACAGAASIALHPAASAASIALAFGLGLVTATLWQRERGAFSAVGLAAGFGLLSGSALNGGLFDGDWHKGRLSLGPSAFGAPAWLAAACAIGLAVAITKIVPEAPRRGVADERER